MPDVASKQQTFLLEIEMAPVEAVRDMPPSYERARSAAAIAAAVELELKELRKTVLAWLDEQLWPD